MSTGTLEKCALYRWIPVSTVPGRWQMCVGELFADVNMNRAPYGGGGVMVWADISYGQRTPLHFIDGHLNAQRYRDEILRLIVVPFICRHHLKLQHQTHSPMLLGSVHNS